MMIKIKYLYLCFLLIISGYFFLTSDLNVSSSILINFYLINCICICGLFIGLNFGFKQIFYIFTLIFMCFVPLLEIKHNIFYYKSTPFDFDDYFLPSLIVLYTSFIFLIIDIYFRINFKFTSKGFIKYRLKLFKIFNVQLLFVFLILIKYDFNLLLFFFRGLANPDNINSIRSLDLIFNTIIRPLPIVLSLIVLFNYKGVKLDFLNSIIYYLIIIVGIISYFPTSAPRFMIFAFYLPLIYYFINFKSSISFPHFILIPLFTVFPYLSNFRRVSFDMLAEIEYKLDLEFLLHGHFDAFQNFSRVINSNLHVELQQFFSGIFFFIPRAFWESKALSSGLFVGNFFNYSQTNVGFPLIGEFYLSFSIIGILLFPIIIFLLCRYFDNRITGYININQLPHIIYTGLFIYLLRGDLSTSLSSFVGVVILFIILNTVKRYFICEKKISN